ncbi:MAG TPA: hypothetical protein VGQ99_24040 [Tepidisphaeraceae bacterium]|jgi:hypothetical protein|nr:hypothetical protein [Tepidisphaeraceae bacterium]
MKYLLSLTLLLAGCASEPNPSVRQRQDDALRDPMNYSPNVTDRNDVSGGGITDLKKDGLKKDLNSVFNP